MRHRPLLLVLLVLLAAPAPPAHGLASGWEENPESRVRLVTPYRVAPRDGEIWLGLHFRLAPEWHVYWKNSGDAGFPPVIDLAATPEVGDAELLWPAPERFELPGDLVAFGYADEVLYPIRATMAAGARERVEIALVVDYLVCRVDCIPYRYTLRVDQPVAPEPVPDPETAPLLDRWRDRMPVPAADLSGVETRGHLDVADLREPVLTITVDGTGAAPGVRPELFLEAHDLYEPARPELEEGPAALRFRVPLGLKRALEEAPASATFAWTVTGLAAPGRPEDAGPMALEARRTVTTEPPERPAPAPPRTGPAPVSAFGIVLRAFAGGLLLALSPGALALLLVVLGRLRALAADRPDAVLRRGAAAAGGVVAAALVLAAADVATGGGGWSRLLQEPVAVASLALVTLLFALGLWGLLGPGEHGASRTRGGGDGRDAASAFAAGAFLPVLALPWAVPPASVALDRAAALGPAASVTATLAAGVGLALPLVAGAALFRRRPRPRSRSGTGSREVLGFVAATSLLWLLYVLAGLLDPEDLAFAELSLLGLGLAAWARHRASRRVARWVWSAVAVVAAAAVLWLAAVG